MITSNAHVDGVAPETLIVRDIIKRAAYVTPAFLLVSGLIWGLNGAYSSAYGLAIVVCNFALAAALLSWSASISTGLMMGAALFGYLIRLALIFMAIWFVRDAAWVVMVPLGLTIIIAHLGLLFWEMKYISASLAFPALKPSAVSKESSAQ
ncbi:MAG: ATP synthase subunit I [Actinomycetes bacterium]